jgi:hypothetical protein
VKESTPLPVFPAIEFHLLHIIFASDYSESSHSRTLRSRLQPWEFASHRRHPNAFKRFAFGLQIGLGIVVGGVEADVPEPASDHCDVHAGRDQMYGSRMPEAVRRDVLRHQARHFLGRRRDVMGELEAHPEAPSGAP